MAYRVAKKTTIRKQCYCLKCTHCKVIDKQYSIVKCTAPNSCFKTEFNANDWYCTEIKNLNEMDFCSREKIREKIIMDKNRKEFIKYCRKFYDKATADRKIKEYKEKLKG